jgi:DNA-binding transcriptional LysR family regulator
MSAVTPPCPHCESVGEIDFTVGLPPSWLNGVEFASESFYEDTVVAAVRSGHPLVRIKRPSWSMLSNFPMVLPTTATSLRGTIDMVLARHQVMTDRSRVEIISAMMTIGVLALACAPFAAAAGIAAAQAFPDKSVKIVVPPPPGSPPDLLARIVGEGRARLWKQPVAVENRPGGWRTTGNSRHAARS